MDNGLITEFFWIVFTVALLSVRHQGRVVELIPEKFLRRYMSSVPTLGQVGMEFWR